MQPDIVQELEKIHEHILMELEEGTDDLSDIEIRVSELMINLQSKQLTISDKDKVVPVLSKHEAERIITCIDNEVACDCTAAETNCFQYLRDLRARLQDQLKKAVGDG